MGPVGMETGYGCFSGSWILGKQCIRLPLLLAENYNIISNDPSTERTEDAQISLRKFLEDEADIYTLEDLKVRYK